MGCAARFSSAGGTTGACQLMSTEADSCGDSRSASAGPLLGQMQLAVSTQKLVCPNCHKTSEMMSPISSGKLPFAGTRDVICRFLHSRKGGKRSFKDRGCQNASKIVNAHSRS